MIRPLLKVCCYGLIVVVLAPGAEFEKPNQSSFHQREITPLLMVGTGRCS